MEPPLRATGRNSAGKGKRGVFLTLINEFEFVKSNSDPVQNARLRRTKAVGIDDMPRAVPPRLCLRPGQVILVHSIARSQTKRSSSTRWLDQGDYEPVEPAIDPNEGPISIGERLARFSSQLSYSFLVGAESATLSGASLGWPKPGRSVTGRSGQVRFITRLGRP